MVVLQKFEFSNSTTENCAQHWLDLHSKAARLNDILNTAEKRWIAEILLEICHDCTKMAALPQGAFAACKLRENYRERDLMISRMKSGGDKNDAKYMSSENKKLTDYSPVKYNGKLMKSIWGLYNRYSPHNIKANEEAEQGYYLQQQTAVASFAIAQNLTMAMESGNERRFMEK